MSEGSLSSRQKLGQSVFFSVTEVATWEGEKGH